MIYNEKILLINPNWTGIRKQKQLQFKRFWQPLDLAITAALLEKEGFSVQILDNNIACLTPLEIAELSEDFDKVFVTSTPYDRWQCPSLNIDFFFDTIRYVSKNRLYLMGAHVTERPEAILKHSGARAAILNEPEQTIVDIAKRDISHEVPSDIPGIAYLRENQFIRSSSRGYLKDMDQLPNPAFHLLPMDKYFYELMGTNFTILESSRGCPYQCNFCYLGMYGTRYRQKSIQRVIDEIKYVTKRFNVKNVYFMDLEFGLNRSYLNSFCNALIREKIDIQWCCQTRVTDLDREALRLMRNSGCSLIHFGVEAGSDRILKQIGKKIQISDCITVVKMAREEGIRTALFMNFGFPGETKEEMESTINLAILLNPTYAAFHLIVPFPGTDFAREVDLDPEAFPVNEYPHYNFVGHDLKTLKSVLRKAYLRFYLRPTYVRRLFGKQTGHTINQAKLFLKLWIG